MARLAPRAGMLVPANDTLRRAMLHTSGGHEAIVLREFDAVLMVGFLWAYPPSVGYYSHAAALQALFDITPKTVAVNLLRKIRRISDVPVFLAHQPLRSYDGDFDETAELAPYRRLVGLLNSRFLEKEGAVLLPQPPQTIAASFFTRPEFAIGSIRLDIGSGDTNAEPYADPRSHMNARYGDIYLSTHLPTIAFGEPNARFAKADGMYNIHDMSQHGIRDPCVRSEPRPARNAGLIPTTGLRGRP